MHFEHLIQINDPRLALVDFLSRQQLWLGLVHRGRSPAGFARGLEGSTVDSEHRTADVTTLNRTLDFGTFRVRDQVRLVEGSHIVITAVATEQWPQSTLSITIEEPAPELLFLRFIYEYPDADFGQPEDRLVAELRRQAYEQSDIDTVVRIRELAASGELGDYIAPPGRGYGTPVPQ
ncbi:MAG: hypothetical protein RLZZ403_278 [Pseudomonadota bacterium]|jgi:hypothetical protein